MYLSRKRPCSIVWKPNHNSSKTFHPEKKNANFEHFMVGVRGFLCLSVCLSFCHSVCLYVSLSGVCLSVCLSVWCLSVCLSLSLSFSVRGCVCLPAVYRCFCTYMVNLLLRLHPTKGHLLQKYLPHMRSHSKMQGQKEFRQLRMCLCHRRRYHWL